VNRGRRDLLDEMKLKDSKLMSHELYPKACRVLLFSALCLLVAGAYAAGQASQQTAGGNAPSTSAPTAAASSPEGSKYVGAETCKTCHEEIYNAWEKTPHWKTTLNLKGGPSKQGCEGCHGPGADHVAGGGDKTKIFVFEEKSRQETSARCLSCHGEAHPQSHFAESAHSSSDVGCLDCHSPHHAKEKEFLLVREQPQLCYGCHTSAKADFAKPYHHRVNEGLVQCGQRPCGSYGACPAVTPFATSAISTNKVLSSMSTCR
jgi:predicted CXXCH cytochrome family protein